MSDNAAVERDRFLRDLTELRLGMRELDLAFETFRKGRSGQQREDALAIGVRLSDLRLAVVDLATRAIDLLATAPGQPASDPGGEPPARLH